MEFCPECGSMLLPTEDNELKCSCGYTKTLSKDKSEYNVNEKIKMVEEKIGRNPMKEVKTKPLPTKYIFNPDDVKTADPLIRWINTLKDEIKNKKSR